MCSVMRLGVVAGVTGVTGVRCKVSRPRLQGMRDWPTSESGKACTPTRQGQTVIYIADGHTAIAIHQALFNQSIIFVIINLERTGKHQHCKKDGSLIPPDLETTMAPFVK